LIDTFKRYSPAAGLALIGRIMLAIWPVEAVHTSQSALLDWPVFMTVLLLGFPVVHFAERWGVSPTASGKRSTLRIILKSFVGGALLAIFLIIWDFIFVLPRDMNVIGVISVPFYIRSVDFQGKLSKSCFLGWRATRCGVRTAHTTWQSVLQRLPASILCGWRWSHLCDQPLSALHLQTHRICSHVRHALGNVLSVARSLGNDQAASPVLILYWEIHCYYEF